MKLKQTFCFWCWVASLPLALALAALARGEETLPAGLNVVALEVRPATVELKQKFEYRQLLVSGKLATGETVDLTRLAKVSQTGKAVTVSADGLVRPAADGADELTFTYGALTAKVPVTVAGVNQAGAVSFVKDVQPVLARMGCNQGTCHGAKEGKSGFKLSLRGYDPLYDHRALTDDIGARRFNRAAPDQSLMLLKATGSIPHVGGARTDVGHPYYELVREWIAQGVKLDLNASRVAKIDVYPLNPIVPLPNMKQQITVLATYADGGVRDVTREAFIESGNIEVLEAAPGGVVGTLRRGEAPVLVRYEGAYAATTIICMGDRGGFAWQQPAEYNSIDKLVYKKLQQVKVLPSEVCSDDEFVRRIYLDLTGLPPTVAQTVGFLSDARESRVKRESLIDQLIGGKEYIEHWTNKWADLLQVNRKFLGEEGSIALRNWIKESIATNKPYDKFAAEILTATGSTLENPPAAYYKTIRDPESLMENTTHLFLAVRFNCNKCHDHPFERWTQDQYYHLSAFFAQIGRKPDPAFAGQTIGGSAVEGANPLVEVVFDSGAGEVTHIRTGQTSTPTFPYPHADVLPAAASRRQQLSKWITSKDNQYFAKSYVNRLWGYLFGIGIIEPIDDIRAGNPPSNPELLDALAKEFVDSGFNVQQMLRTICKSRTYQHSYRTNKWNEDDSLNYSHSLPRRLPAESLFDAIHLAAGSQMHLPGLPAGMRAAELPDAGVSDAFLDDFGKPVRESACECERSSGMVLGPIMKLINGPTVANALADPGSELNQLVAKEADDNKVIEEVFLRFLARRPTAKELELGGKALKASSEDYDKSIAKAVELEKQLADKQLVWEQSAGKPAVWMPLDFTKLESKAGATFKKAADQSVVVEGKLDKDVYTFSTASDLPAITGVRLEALSDPALPSGGPGRAPNGNFVLNEFTLLAGPKADPAKAAKVTLQNGQADFSQESFSANQAVDGNEGTGWAISPQVGKSHFLTFETAADVKIDDGAALVFSLAQSYTDGLHQLGKLRISVTNSPRPLSGSPLPGDVAAALAVAADKRTAEQKAALANHFRSLEPETVQKITQLRQAAEGQRNARQIGVQDLAWALINNPAFLFNR